MLFVQVIYVTGRAAIDAVRSVRPARRQDVLRSCFGAICTSAVIECRGDFARIDPTTICQPNWKSGSLINEIAAGWTRVRYATSLQRPWCLLHGWRRTHEALDFGWEGIYTASESDLNHSDGRRHAYKLGRNDQPAKSRGIRVSSGQWRRQQYPLPRKCRLAFVAVARFPRIYAQLSRDGQANRIDLQPAMHLLLLPSQERTSRHSQ